MAAIRDRTAASSGDPAVDVAQAIVNGAKANEAAAERIAGLFDQIKAEAATTLRSQCLQEMHHAALRILAFHLRWKLIQAGAGAVALIVLGAAGDRWLLQPHSDISGMVCQDDQGGRVCYKWVTPPRQDAAPAPLKSAPVQPQTRGGHT